MRREVEYKYKFGVQKPYSLPTILGLLARFGRRDASKALPCASISESARISNVFSNCINSKTEANFLEMPVFCPHFLSKPYGYRIRRKFDWQI